MVVVIPVIITQGGIVGTLSVIFYKWRPYNASDKNGGSGFGNSSSHRTIWGTYSSGTLHFRTKFDNLSMEKTEQELMP